MKRELKRELKRDWKTVLKNSLRQTFLWRLVVLITMITLSAQPVLGKELYEYLWNSVLKSAVSEGSKDRVSLTLVDYKSLLENQNFQTIVRGFNRIDPSKFTSKEAKLAFWINTYNIAAIHLVLENYPVRSIKDIGTIFSPVWHKPAITIFNKTYTLSEIEHDILRKMEEPRIHFAIVCASISCPDLRKEAYTAERIYEQLEDQTRRFLSNKSKGISLDKKFKIMSISSLFKWFKPDFEQEGTVRDFISKWVKKKPNTSAYKLQYKRYNWKLNDG